MVRRSWVGVLVLLCTAAATAPALGQDKLEWKFKEGDRFFLESVTDMKQAMKVMGQEISMDMKMTAVNSVTVKKKNDDGSVVLEQKIEAMKGDMSGPMGDMSLEDQFKGLIGAAYTVTLAPNSDVTKVEGLKELMEKVGGDNPIVAQMMNNMMKEDNLKRQLAASFSFLPKKPVKVGDSWDLKTGVPLGPLGDFKVEQTFTYRGMDKVDGKDVAKIDSTAKLTYTPSKEKNPAMPIEVTKADFKSTDMKGTYYFDPAAGRLVKNEVKMRFAGSMTMSAAGNEMQMEMDQNMTTTTTVKDKIPSSK